MPGNRETGKTGKTGKTTGKILNTLFKGKIFISPLKSIHHGKTGKTGKTTGKIPGMLFKDEDFTFKKHPSPQFRG